MTQAGFPRGPVLTTTRMLDVFWPEQFKTRALATMRNTSPHILIGIGDRHSDISAYRANKMLAVVLKSARGNMTDDSMLSLGRFLEIELDALTGEVLEMEDETMHSVRRSNP